jgi:hypothetical protein
MSLWDLFNRPAKFSGYGLVGLTAHRWSQAAKKYLKGQNTTADRLNGIQIDRSNYGACVPLVYGMTRIPFSLLWYGGWTPVAHTQKQNGGKGGLGAGGKSTTYTYKASMVLGLCEGQINGLGKYWADKEQHTSITDFNFALFAGSSAQPVWSYLSSNFPSQAIPYDRWAYIGAPNFDLGDTGAVPNFTFEVQALQCFNPGAGVYDANASAIVTDYCTNTDHGCGFPYLTGITGAGNTFESYCIAMGFQLSPKEDQQRQAVEFLDEILRITNSQSVLSPGVGLKIIPYADTPVTGTVGGVTRTYTPDMTPLYTFGDDDYIYGDGEEPVRNTRTPPEQTFNKVRVEFLDRALDYNTNVAEATDDQDVLDNGERVMPTVTFHAIPSMTLARRVAQLLLQRQLYIKNTYEFSVRPDYCLLEPMDLVALNDSVSGLVNQLVRIQRVQDSADDDLLITAEEVLLGAASAPLYATGAVAGYNANAAVAPGNVQTPLIFAAPQYLVDVNGGYEIWIALAGQTPAVWAGCDVWCSVSGADYVKVGTHYGPSRYGLLTATFASGVDPDTTSTLSVSLADSSMTVLGGSQADADEMRTLLYVDGEIVSYQYAALTGFGTYTFTSNGSTSGTKYMRRGKYGSAIAAHGTGTKWCRIDDGLFRMPYDPGMIGKTLQFKFTSFNPYGKGQQQLSDVTAFPYVLKDAASGSALPGNSTFVPRGGAVVVGDRLSKQSGTNASWDSDVRSVEAFSGGCSAVFSFSRTDVGAMGGLNSDPLTDTSYASIDYAWYGAEDGIARIYESGNLVSTYGAYSPDTRFAITYDGVLFRYYRDGVIQREVQAAGKVVFFDSSFYHVGAALSGVFFGAANSAPSGRLTATGNCVVVGNTVQKVGGISAWDSSVYSNEVFAGGVYVTWRFRGTSVSENYMFGLNTDPTTDSSYLSLDYAIECYQTNQFFIYESANLQLSGTAAPGDVFALRYDGQWVRYYQNSTVLREKFAPGLTLYVDSSFAEPTTLALDVAFGPLSSATPNPFRTTGLVIVSDTTFTKAPSAVAAWDAQVYSIQGYATCHASAKANEIASYQMFGFNVDPTNDASYVSLDFAWYTAFGNLAIYESGAQVAAVGTYTTKTFLAVTYDGTTIRYYKDDVQTPVRSVTAPGLTLFFDSSFNTAGGGFNSVRYGPGVSIALLDSAQLGQNAATEVGSTPYGPVDVYSSSVVSTLLASLSVPPYPFATEHVVTMTGSVDLHAVSAQFPAYATITDFALSGASIGSADATIARNPSTALPDDRNSYSREVRYSVAAGTAKTYYANAQSGGISAPGSTCNIYGNFKVEAIKK